MKEVLEAEAQRPGRVLAWDLIREKATGFGALWADLQAMSWQPILDQSGVSREMIRQVAHIYLGAQRVIACWAMGLRQHAHGVANVQEVLNLLLREKPISLGPGCAGRTACAGTGYPSLSEEASSRDLLRLYWSCNPQSSREPSVGPLP